MISRNSNPLFVFILIGLFVVGEIGAIAQSKSPYTAAESQTRSNHGYAQVISAVRGTVIRQTARTTHSFRYCRRPASTRDSLFTT
jgi:hypothetical protein